MKTENKTHWQVVIDSKVELVRSYADQINAESATVKAYVDGFDRCLLITVDEDHQKTIINEYELSVDDLRRAVEFLSHYVTVSPSSSVDKEVFPNSKAEVA